MKTIGAFDAKTHFSQILAAVINGEEFIITKRGQEVAMIIPIQKTKPTKDPIKEAIDAIRKLRKGVKLGKKLSIKSLIEKGRK